MTNKQRKIERVKEWVGMFQKRVESNHSVIKNDLTNVDLNQFTASQLQVILGLISASYNNGSGTTRDFFAKAKQRKNAGGES